MVKAELRANKLWREEYDDDDREWLTRAVDLIRQRFHTLKDFSGTGPRLFFRRFRFRRSGGQQEPAGKSRV